MIPAQKIKTVFLFKSNDGTKDKKIYGIGVKFDPKKERTYAGVTVNSSGSNLNIKQKFGDPESIESAKPGTELGVDNPPVSDQAEATMDIDVKKSKVASLAIAGTENDLKLINSINHVYTEKDKEDAEKRGETVEVGKRKPTVFAWKDEYKKDTIAKKKQFFNATDSIATTFNPYPNENDELYTMNVVGDTTVNKAFVKGQLIHTGAKIENIDANGAKRIVGQVYFPTGEIVEGASTFVVTEDNKDKIAKKFQTKLKSSSMTRWKLARRKSNKKGSQALSQQPTRNTLIMVNKLLLRKKIKKRFNQPRELSRSVLRQKANIFILKRFHSSIL